MEAGPIFFPCSLSLHFSKPKISIYLRVFVIELLFLIAWKGLGWICLLAGIVTLTFDVQSIDYFHNTNSELTVYLLIKQSLLFIPTDIRSLFEEYLRPPGRRFGIMKPLILDESHQHASKNRGVFLFRDSLSPLLT